MSPDITQHTNQRSIVLSSTPLRRAGDWLAAALLLAVGGCSLAPAPQFQVTGTGSLSGILYLDRDGNGIYDPSSGDSALGNVHLVVYSRGTTQIIAGADTHTDSSGRFSFTNLPAGTNSLQVDTTGIGSALAFCNNPLPVSIYLNETNFVSVNAQAGCVIPIVTAEASALGTRVTVTGTVTSTLAQISTGEVYIEDATGGIQLFSPTGGTPLSLGDVVQVSGTLASFDNELELSPVTINTQTAGTPLTAFDVTSAAAAAAAGDVHANLQGRLIRIKAGKLIDVFTTGAGRNAQVDDGSGAVAVRFDTHVVADTTVLKTTYTAGHCYNWTGILKAFTNPGVELFPRSLADVTEGACP
jgi:hypothetical protein